MPPQIEEFSNHLFWDVQRSILHIDKNDAYIIRQVLEYGKLNDWLLIKNYYGIAHITQKAVEFRLLDKKALSFISTISNVPINKFRCYTTQQSSPQHWNF